MRFLILFFAAAGFAQVPPGSVVRTSVTTVTATAVSGSSTMICVFSNPAPPQLRTVCSVGGTVRYTLDVNIAVGAIGTGAIGAYVEAGNNITWSLRQLTAGNFTFEIAANGVLSGGAF